MQLRAFQREALAHLYAHDPRHVLCIAATGSGKSLIYEEAAKRYRLLLVTPLVALARQQVASLVAKGIEASSTDRNAHVFVASPESLAKKGRVHADLLVVDECHCIWEWAEHFRTDFAFIPNLIHDWSIRRSLWLTATLPALAKKQLLAAIKAPVVEVGHFAMPHQVAVRVIACAQAEKLEILRTFLSGTEDPGIIYVHTRVFAERLTRLCQAEGRSVAMYHAGMAREERLAIENAMRQGLLRLVIATSAFGMGMNYTQIRFVLIWQSPPSLLSLVQMMGRVGRLEHEHQRAIVLWDADNDPHSFAWMLQTDKAVESAQELITFLSDKSACRRALLASYFGSNESACGFCDYCQNNTSPFLEKTLVI